MLHTSNPNNCFIDKKHIICKNLFLNEFPKKSLSLQDAGEVWNFEQLKRQPYF